MFMLLPTDRNTFHGFLSRTMLEHLLDLCAMNIGGKKNQQIRISIAPLGSCQMPSSLDKQMDSERNISHLI